MFAVLLVRLDGRAENFHERRVFGRRQRTHHAALVLATRGQRRQQGQLQEVEALQGNQAVRATFRLRRVQAHCTAGHRRLETLAVAAHALQRFALGIKRPFPQRRHNRCRTGAGFGKRRIQSAGGRYEQVRCELAHIGKHRGDG